MKKICVLGMGYIGMPTACILADNGNNVLGVDVNDEVINSLNSGKIHLDEPELEEIFLNVFKNKRLRVSNTIEKSDVYIITVPTPLASDKKADLSYVKNATYMIKEVISKGCLVILESTSPPGTSRDVIGKIIFNETGLYAGKDYFLAFCPERVLPGKIIYELKNNDRIIGGVNEESTLRAKEIYSSFVKGDIHTTDLETSEFVKLAENTYRDVNIAFSNELAQICKEYKIDIWEVIKLANMHPRVNILNPGPGVGGHCIPIDPWFILDKISRKNTLIEKSRHINDGVPKIIVDNMLKVLKDYIDPKVSIWGFAYKENVGDYRESPAIQIYDSLRKRGVDVKIYDPLVNTNKYKISRMEESIDGSDLLLLFTGHEEFKKNDFKKIYSLMRNKNIFDTRNFFDKKILKNMGFNLISI